LNNIWLVAVFAETVSVFLFFLRPSRLHLLKQFPF
jgi:hypothetical protein